eukprot:TRINITY_DN15426_c0_g1_i1.p1 TRINITY_DN15426_c0_g1~~TRINITY_DN15426_c0_g1_i1.p1  ORF type:complete len:669 (+),score=171.33 TRINITY_DN15426_c0_g1_i1:46-2007(+)
MAVLWSAAAVLTAGVHVPDNGDGTYTNPAMPNAHWSDPSVLRTDGGYLLVSSSSETAPVIQVLQSQDLVNWDVVTSLFRDWPETDPVEDVLVSTKCTSEDGVAIAGLDSVPYGTPVGSAGDCCALCADPPPGAEQCRFYTYLKSSRTCYLKKGNSSASRNSDAVSGWVGVGPAPAPADPASMAPRLCWSPRISQVGAALRVMYHQGGDHFLVAESTDAEGPWKLIKHNLTGMANPPQYAASVFHDADGRLLVYASNWIRRVSEDGLSFTGPRVQIADMSKWGFLENPFLMARGGHYYWFASAGAATIGEQGEYLLNKGGTVVVYRSKDVLGPYEGPRDFLTGTVEYQGASTMTMALGPDNSTWYAVYNAIEMARWTLARQLMVDPVHWGDDGWPLLRLAGRTHRKPLSGFSPTWTPDLTDEFNESTLEGVTSGVLGRKWLFKKENRSLWSIGGGALRLSAGCNGIDSGSPPNLLVQRPASSSYRIEAEVTLKTGACVGEAAGVIVREVTSGQGVAVGLQCVNGSVYVVAWGDAAGTYDPPYINEVGRVEVAKAAAVLAIDVNGPTILGSFTNSSTSAPVRFLRKTTDAYLPLDATNDLMMLHVHDRRGHEQTRFFFTTLHPGLFAGGGGGGSNASGVFSYFRHTDREKFAPDD